MLMLFKWFWFFILIFYLIFLWLAEVFRDTFGKKCSFFWKCLMYFYFWSFKIALEEGMVNIIKCGWM
jgi:hypothetical protein